MTILETEAILRL